MGIKLQKVCLKNWLNVWKEYNINKGNIKEQINEVLKPYEAELNEILEGYVSISIHKGEPDIVTVHKTGKVGKWVLRKYLKKQ